MKEYKPKENVLHMPVAPTADKHNEVLVSNALRGSFP